MNLDEAPRRAALETFLASAAQAQTVRITHWSRLAGGAIQQNLRIDCDVVGGPHRGSQRWVLRTDAPSLVASSRTRGQEFALLQVAQSAGVIVPRPYFLHVGDDDLPSCFVMGFCEGIAAGHRLTKDAAIADRPAFLRAAGSNLAHLHAIAPPEPRLVFLGTPTATPTRDYLMSARVYLDHFRETFGDAYPALEWGIRWWLRNVPGREKVTLLHHDYRTGNLMVVNGRLGATLDWEFAGWGNPLEDLGWFCAPCWRFGRRDRGAGGIGEVDDLLAGYNAVRGTTWSAKDLMPWQALAQIRWAIIALQQTERHLSGAQRSLELALTGRLLPELEHDLLHLIARCGTMGHG